MLAACVRDRELLPAAQSMDLRFDDFNADDIGSVRRIYALAGMSFPSEVEQAMRRFVAENPRGGGKAIRYDPAQLGLDRAALAERLRFYSERFSTRAEG
jgi:hypothetical protein